MKSIWVFFSYFLMIVMCFTFTIPIIDTVYIFGYTLRYFVYYILAFSLPFVIGFVYAAEGKKFNSRFFYAFFFIVFSCIISIQNDTPFTQKASEALLFMLPIALCAIAENSSSRRKTCIDFLIITNVVASILSFFVANGTINVNIWAAEGELVRTAGAINSTLGIGGFVATTILLFSDAGLKKTSFSRKCFVITGFISSALVVLFSLSRTRIALLVAVCICIFLYNLVSTKTLQGNYRMLVFIVLFSILILKLFPDVTSMLIEAIGGRYSLGNDGNIRFRNLESSTQFELFKESPIFGKGWGMRENISVFNGKMFVHNIYTSLLMQTGIVGTLLYLCWQLSYFKTLIKVIKIEELKIDALIGLMFLVVLFVLGFTNSGLTQSGAFFMMFYVAALTRDIEAKMNVDLPKGENRKI